LIFKPMYIYFRSVFNRFN